MKVWGAYWGPKLRDHCHEHSGEHVCMLPRIPVALTINSLNVSLALI